MQKININIYSEKLAQLRSWAMPRLIPLFNRARDYWKHLSQREQYLVMLGGILAGIMVLFSIVSSAIDMENSLHQQITTTQEQLVYTQAMASTLKDLSQITANEFSTATADKIKSDIGQLFDIKTPDVSLVDHALTISIPSAKFELVMLFLDQLRKTYGIFPEDLKLTRIAQSGYVSFHATFNIED